MSNIFFPHQVRVVKGWPPWVLDFNGFGILWHTTNLCLQANGVGFIKLVVSYVLTNEEKWRFVQIILQLEIPTHYVFSLKKQLQNDGDLRGMKSHDFHVMMQDILPLCMWHLMAKGRRMAAVHLSHVLKKLCAKIVDPRTMDDFKHDVAVTVVLLKKKLLLFLIPWHTF